LGFDSNSATVILRNLSGKNLFIAGNPRVIGLDFAFLYAILRHDKFPMRNDIFQYLAHAGGEARGERPVF